MKNLTEIVRESFTTNYKESTVELVLYEEEINYGGMIIREYVCYDESLYPNGQVRNSLKFKAYDRREALALFKALKEEIQGYRYKEIYIVRVLIAPKGFEHIARTKAFENIKEAEGFLEELNDNNVGASLEPINYYESKE